MFGIPSIPSIMNYFRGGTESPIQETTTEQTPMVTRQPIEAEIPIDLSDIHNAPSLEEFASSPPVIKDSVFPEEKPFEEIASTPVVNMEDQELKAQKEQELKAQLEQELRAQKEQKLKEQELRVLKEQELKENELRSQALMDQELTNQAVNELNERECLDHEEEAIKPETELKLPPKSLSAWGRFHEKIDGFIGKIFGKTGVAVKKYIGKILRFIFVGLPKSVFHLFTFGYFRKNKDVGKKGAKPIVQNQEQPGLPVREEQPVVPQKPENNDSDFNPRPPSHNLQGSLPTSSQRQILEQIYMDNLLRDMNNARLQRSRA